MDVNNVSEVMKNFSGDNGMPVGIDGFFITTSIPDWTK
jgi:hypothetical protein